MSIPLVSKPKRKQLINDKVQFHLYKQRYLSSENWTEFGKYEPFPKLKALIVGNEMKLYDNEKDKISNIKAAQPKWENPKWTDGFDDKMTNLILKHPLSRESAERWMVEHIDAKTVYNNWKKRKTEFVKKFINQIKHDILINIMQFQWIKIIINLIGTQTQTENVADNVIMKASYLS